MRIHSGRLSRLFVMLCATLLLSPPVMAEIGQKDFEKAMEKYLATEKGQKFLGESIEKYFKKRQDSARKDQMAKAAAQMEEQFKNPVKIDAGVSPSKGPKNAKITIIEFSDFQCPYCSKVNDTIDEIMKNYPKDVKVVFKNLPLPFHKEAEPAARAALAAGEQGKFWEMHDKLFENQRKLSSTYYDQAAKELGLDVAKFKKDMASDKIKKQVKADAELAGKHEIRGTPGFFVNGVAVKGAYPFEHFKKIIDRHLSKNG